MGLGTIVSCILTKLNGKTLNATMLPVICFFFVVHYSYISMKKSHIFFFRIIHHIDPFCLSVHV